MSNTSRIKDYGLPHLSTTLHGPGGRAVDVGGRSMVVFGSQVTEQHCSIAEIPGVTAVVIVDNPYTESTPAGSRIFVASHAVVTTLN